MRLVREYKNIKCLDYVSESKKKNLLKIASVFVLPLRFEAQPITVLEALVSGVPVILSNIEVLKDIINLNKSFGVCLKENDSKNLLYAIFKYYKKFSKSPKKYSQFRLGIMREARKIFDIKVFRTKFLDMLE